jgi:diacylglycerol kinase family enzyme
MAGIGFDAMLLDSTSEPLKRRLGWVAYSLSAMRHLWARPARATLLADGGRVLRRRASGIIVGNVGSLQGGVSLLPGAEPDDGLLDLMVLTARGWSGWLALTVDVFLRRTRTGRVAHSVFRELRVQLDRPQLWELDGEVMGTTSELVVVVQPGRLLVRVPR